MKKLTVFAVALVAFAWWLLRSLDEIETELLDEPEGWLPPDFGKWCPPFQYWEPDDLRRWPGLEGR